MIETRCGNQFKRIGIFILLVCLDDYYDFFLIKMRGSVPELKLFVVFDWENDTGRKDLRRKAQREKEGKINDEKTSLHLW